MSRSKLHKSLEQEEDKELKDNKIIITQVHYQVL